MRLCGGHALRHPRALGSEALAEYGPAPRTLAYLLLVGALGLCALLIALSRETAPRVPGLRTSMRPQVRIPVAARPLLPVACAIMLGFARAPRPTTT